jgi:hypothetical protein
LFSFCNRIKSLPDKLRGKFCRGRTVLSGQENLLAFQMGSINVWFIDRLESVHYEITMDRIQVSRIKSLMHEMLTVTVYKTVESRSHSNERLLPTEHDPSQPG